MKLIPLKRIVVSAGVFTLVTVGSVYAGVNVDSFLQKWYKTQSDQIKGDIDLIVEEGVLSASQSLGDLTDDLADQAGESLLEVFEVNNESVVSSINNASEALSSQFKEKANELAEITQEQFKQYINETTNESSLELEQLVESTIHDLVEQMDGN